MLGVFVESCLKKKSVMQTGTQGEESLSQLGSLICHGTNLESGHIMEYYSAMKRNEWLLHTMPWMNLNINVLDEGDLMNSVLKKAN